MTSMFSQPVDPPLLVPATGGRLHRYAELFARIDEDGFPAVPDSVRAIRAAVAGLDAIEGTSRAGLDAFCDNVVGEIVAGRALPKDFVAEARRAEEAGAQQQAARIATMTIRNKLGAQVPTVIDQAVPKMLAGIRDAVDALVAQGRDAAETLGDLDIGDAGSVADASDPQREAIKTIAALRLRYEDLRASQRTLIRAVRSETLRDLKIPTGSKPGLKDVFLAGVHEFANAASGALEQDPDSNARFLEVVRQADVWVPELAELGRTWRAVVAAGAAPAARMPVAPQGSPSESRRVRPGDLIVAE